MAGGNKTTTRENQTVNPYAPAQPAIGDALSGIRSWMNAPSSKEYYQGPRYVGMSDMTRRGISDFGAATGARGARDYMSRVLSGDYLNQGNPYQSALDDNIRASVMPSVNAQFSNSGMAGSTLHQGMLEKALTQGLAAPRYQNYQAERGMQQAAATALPGIDAQIGQSQIQAGQTAENYARERMAADMQAFNDRRMAGILPYMTASPLIQGLGSMGRTSTGTSTQSTSTSPINTLLGAGMMGASLMSGNPMGMAGLMGGGGMFGAYNPMWPTRTYG